MASGVIYIIGLIVVIAGLGSVYYFNVMGAQQQVQAVAGFIEKSNCFPDGSCVTVLINEPPKSEGDAVNTVEIEDVKIVNGSYVTETKTIIVPKEEGIPQIRKDDPRGVEVQGYIKLISAVTKTPIKPYLYNVLITIECDETKNTLPDGYNYCNTTPIFGRVTTDDVGVVDGEEKGGYYLYRWHPKFTDALAFYDVTVLVTSDVKNSQGQYENYENTYKIQVIN